jgi:integrase/recombinase XerD
MSVYGTHLDSSIPFYLKASEVASIFSASSGSMRDHMLLKSLYYLGLRNSELRALRIMDIDAQGRKVNVSEGVGAKKRAVPIPGEFADELLAFIGERKDGLLFEGRGSGGELSDRHLRRIVKQYAMEAKVANCEKAHPHTLRHSYAMHLQNSGVPLHVIQCMLGHAKLETTFIYLGSGMERAREFIEHAFKVRYGEGAKPDVRS